MCSSDLGIRAFLPLDRLTLSAGGGLGYSRVAGDDGAVQGFGGLRATAQCTYTLGPRFPVGLAYVFNAPHSAEVCRGGHCGDLTTAYLQQILVVAGATFW